MKINTHDGALIKNLINTTEVSNICLNAVNYLTAVEDVQMDDDNLNFLDAVTDEQVQQTIVFGAALKLLNEGEENSFISSYIQEHGEVMHAKDYVGNDFVKALISLDGEKLGDYAISTRTVNRYTLMHTGEYFTGSIKAPNVFGKVMGYYTDTITVPVITYAGEPLFKLTPDIVNSTPRYLTKMKGDVCCYGTGSMYAAYIAAAKEDVTSVTLCFESPTFEEFFKETIYPLMPNKEKINFGLLDWNTTRYVFVNNWATEDTKTTAAVRYIAFKKMAAKFPKVKVIYWNEELLLYYFRNLIAQYLVEHVAKVLQLEYEHVEAYKDVWKDELVTRSIESACQSLNIKTNLELTDIFRLTRISTALSKGHF